MKARLLLWWVLSLLAIAGAARTPNPGMSPAMQRASERLANRHQQHHMPAKSPYMRVAENDLENKNLELLLEEDFSLMTEGSEMQLGETIYGANYGPKHNIPDELFHTSGWTGEGIRQAGGMIALAFEDYGGVLNTPLGVYNGKIYITFRARAVKGNAMMCVSGNRNGTAFPMDNASNIEKVQLNEQWQDVCLEFVMPYPDNSSSFQFNGWSYNDGILMDDLKIYRDKDYIYSPNNVAVKNFSDTGFTIDWEDVPNASSYYVNLFRQEPAGTENYTSSVDFNDIDTSTDAFSPDNQPEGWNISLNGDVQVTASEGADQSAAIVMSSDDDCVTLPMTGGDYLDFSCKVIPLTDLSETYCYFVIEGLQDDGTWHECYAADAYYDFEEEGPTIVTLNEEIASRGFLKLRLYITDFYDEQFAIDDIAFTTTPAAPLKRANLMDNASESDFTFTNLDTQYEYFFEVISSTKNGNMSSPVMRRAKGLATPVVDKPATQGQTVTATWHKVNRADKYVTSLYEYSTIAEAAQGFNVLEETFSGVEAGTTKEEPSKLSNYYEVSLDDYCDNKGWSGTNTIMGGNMIGCDETEGGDYICSPQMNLQGKVTLSFSVYAPYDEFLNIQRSDSEYRYAFIPANELTTIQIDFEDCDCDDYFLFYVQFGSSFLIGDVSVSQDIEAGYTLCHTLATKTTDTTQAEFTVESPDNDKEYGIKIRAFKDYPSGSARSAKSPMQKIEGLSMNGIQTSVATPSNISTVTSLQGITLFKGNLEDFKPTAPGVYVVRTGKTAKKVLMK